MREVNERQRFQLESLMAVCERLGAEVRYRPEQAHFTAMIWEDGASSEGYARSIQTRIQEKTAQYSDLVCYCFDAFSTLVYAV